jgi:hypothetical protein
MKFNSAVLFIMFLFQNQLFGQTATIRFIDQDKNAISFVAVRDSSSKIYLSSDSNGVVVVPTNSTLMLTTSHVSFEDKALPLLKMTDTTFTIVLDFKSQFLEAVIISSKKIRKGKKVFEAGNYNQKMDFKRHYIRADKEKVGGLVEIPDRQGPAKYLRSINFKLDESKKLRNDNFVIEIKIFGIVHDRVEREPINLKPIYVTSDKLRKNNVVMISENISLPFEKILVSFELPIVEDKDNNDHIIFLGNAMHDDCSLFRESNETSSWSENLLRQGCGNNPFTHKKHSLNIGITYQQVVD